MLNDIDIKTLTASTVIALFLFLVGAGGFMAWSSQHTTTFGVVDVNAIVAEREQALLKKLEAANKDPASFNKEKESAAIVEFSKTLEIAMNKASEECGCLVLTRAAVLPSQRYVDLTPSIRAKVGM